MIRFEHLSKTFQTKDGAFEALKDVSFEIEKGDIYGVIGYSGAETYRGLRIYGRNRRGRL